MSIRRATVEDCEDLFDLHREVFAAHIEQIWGWDDAWQRTNFAAEFSSTSTTVIEIDGRIAGFVQIRDEIERVYLQNIALAPNHQGHGLGGQIVGDLKTKAADLGLPLELSVFRTNARAVAFYQRLGFAVVARDGDFVRMIWREKS